jgi:hypothetical protein
MAERVSKFVYIALVRIRSPIFEKHLRHRHEPCAGPRARSPQFASNLRANMGRSMGKNVRRKDGLKSPQILTRKAYNFPGLDLGTHARGGLPLA